MKYRITLFEVLKEHPITRFFKWIIDKLKTIFTRGERKNKNGNNM